MSGFAKILFPTDFSKGADCALENVMSLPGLREVVVQHVVSTYFEKHSHWTTLFDIHEMQKYMDMYVQTEMAKVLPQKKTDTINFRTVVSEGKPAQEIVELADKERVDLIVMGPARGVVTGAVTRAASHPVLAVPETETHLRPLQKTAKILVGTDCSPQSKKVVDYAFELKELFNCEVFMLYAIELTSAVKFGIRQGYFKDATLKMRNWARNQLENLTPHQYVSDASVHWLVEEGHASDKIAEFADSYDVDLVVLGAHGYGPVQKHFVGTTTDKIMTKVARPLLTVKM
ncbi:MAG TPA: universal stress protein [Terriglobia bacterium]|nr:universal stress protein [Terriglobia bacterium]